MRVPLNYRIHFALNCGGVSCPAIAFYKPGNIHIQLDDSMKAFLADDVKFERGSTRFTYLPSSIGTAEILVAIEYS
ncbi:MAG: DUF547 domain-containing protein [Chitinophagales bacterium]|nr:DUF547 domain-containing protein [Chitinophagales bacterium]